MNNWILRDLCETCNKSDLCPAIDDSVTFSQDYGIDEDQDCNVVTCEFYNK